MLSSLASMPSQVVARSGEQLRGSLPISTKREVDEVDWEESEEKDVLARLPLDQLLKDDTESVATKSTDM
ncbi:unnamed protein product [Cladocopium goreaui]|uniref:Uncharacterized protein n=1 Tax=Cladocopium goreaui TaxID=2562237 RepID=A0A9P1GDH4_9DINO|nr:unnamed protein product [Cladocopium goreaui]